MEEVALEMSFGWWIEFQQLMMGGKGILGGRNSMSKGREVRNQGMLLREQQVVGP